MDVKGVKKFRRRARRGSFAPKCVSVRAGCSGPVRAAPAGCRRHFPFGNQLAARTGPFPRGFPGRPPPGSVYGLSTVPVLSGTVVGAGATVVGDSGCPEVDSGGAVVDGSTVVAEVS